tara:strand:+ start:240 stop:554 length:315 start_codon:yes stop_codon:yes gene_type:complete
MKLLTDAIIEILPAIYRTENIPLEHKDIIVRFFNPLGSQSWEIFEGDKTEDGDWRLFGNCDLGFGSPELGYVMLSELEALDVGIGLGIERDICVGDTSLHPEWD